MIATARRLYVLGQNDHKSTNLNYSASLKSTTEKGQKNNEFPRILPKDRCDQKPILSSFGFDFLCQKNPYVFLPVVQVFKLCF